MSDEINKLPPGLLSFTYHAIYNPIINKAARVDLLQEMSKFELSDEAKALILVGQLSGSPDSQREARLVELMMQELMATLNHRWQQLPEGGREEE